jgi:MFS family permease
MYSKEEKTTLIGLGMPTIFLRFSKALVMLVFFYYALSFTDNELLIGFAFGITALTQAGLTIPFGFWSDKYGRKKMILIGLIFFIIGSFLAAYPLNNIYILIFARFLQGTSAIYSCVLAFISDVIPDNKHSRTIGLFSIFTGIVFSLGIILGPTISPMFLPYSFLFILSGVLGIIALLYLMIYVNEPETKAKNLDSSPNLKIMKEAFFDKKLLIIYTVTLLSNFVLVSILFLMVPIMLEEYMPSEFTALLLIPIFIVGMIVMMYTSKHADRGKRKIVGINGIILVIIGLILFLFNNFLILIIGLILFFTGMAILDPLLPSFTLELASLKSKGTASGTYNLMRYLGEGTGPIIAGFVLLVFNISILLVLLVLIIFVSLIMFAILGASPNSTTDKN